MAKVSRRIFMGRAGAVLAGAALLPMAHPQRASAQQLKKITFITPFGYSTGYAPVMNAQANGHFRRHGLDVEILPGTGGAMAVSQALAGRADVMRGSGSDIVSAVNKGADLVAICTIYQASPYLVMSHKKSPIIDAKGMVGKTIGLPSRGGGGEVTLDVLAAAAGAPPKEIRREAVGIGLGAWGLMEQGKVQGLLLTVNALARMLEAKLDLHYWMTDQFVPMPGQVHGMTRKRIAQDPQLPVQFLMGIRDSMEDIRKNDKVEMMKRLAKAYPALQGKENIPFLIEALNAEMSLWDTDGRENALRNNPKRFDSIANLMAGAGLVKKIENPSILYTNEYVDRALKSS